jgi:hypothetical protein
MANAAMKEEMVIPDGGIADFYLEDNEIEALEREEARQAFGNAGIAEFTEVASRMASYGRGGDDTIAHVATGEIIIPLPLIENNPRMKASIFNHLRELGVEDPEQYVVGSSANSINPDTGLAEFGWFKKLVKKVKKVVKKVVKVVKKVAPIVLPFILGPAGLGFSSLYAGALGAGIGTLIQGGSIKDAFKSALLGGATGALFSGFQGPGSFGENISNALSTPFVEGGYMANTFGSGATSTPVSAPVSDGGTNFAGTSDTALSTSPSGTPTSVSDVNTAAAIDPATGRPPVSAGTPNNMSLSNYDAATGTFKTPPLGADLSLSQPSSFMDTAKSYYDKSMDYLFRGGQTQGAVSGAQAAAEQKAIQNTLLKYGHQGPLTTAPASIAAKAIAEGQAAAAAAGPGLLATYGPSAALAGTAAYAAGFFDAPKEDPVDTPPTGEELIAADPEKYRISDLEVRRSEGPTEVASPYTIVPGQGTFVNPFYRPQDPRNLPIYAFDRQYAAEGGEIFPRRVGGIMPNEGIPGQDSVRAMLMPGEFVMTTDAVKGLGGGNMRQGINNMYEMMRGLESRGKAMA